MKMLAYLLIMAALVAGLISASTAYMVNIGTTDAPNNGLLPTEGETTFATLSSGAGSYGPLGDLEFILRIEKYQLAEDEYQEIENKPVVLLKKSEPKKTNDSDSEKELEKLETAPTGETLLARREAKLAIGRPDDRVTQELLDLLREKDVQYIRVSAFSLERWFSATGGFMGWVFSACALGLFLGAMIVRRAAKQEIEATRDADADERAGAAEAFAQINSTLETLQRDLAAVPEPRVRTAMVVERLSVIQRDYAPAFVADRPALIGALGLGGYAELMDRFAAMERQINRAWSAGADGHEDEAVTSLYRALAIMPEVAQKMPQ